MENDRNDTKILLADADDREEEMQGRVRDGEQRRRPAKRGYRGRSQIYPAVSRGFGSISR